MASDGRDAPAAEHPGEGPGAGRGTDIPELVDEALGRLRGFVAELSRLLDLRVEQARLRVRGIVLRACVGLWFALVLACATGLALSRLVAGLAGLLGQALGSAWAGDLAAGSIVIGALALAGFVVVARIRRAGLARLQRKFEAPSVRAGRPAAEGGA